jgi:sporulation protein YlmC with PRC-barrel domain
MPANPSAILVRLSDTDSVIADPDDDLRGRTVRDRNGSELGVVEDLLVDPDRGKVRFLRVEHGGILGFGATPSFIPVEAVDRVVDEVHVDVSAGAVARAPRYDPDVVDLADARAVDYYGSVYGYYGYPPFWTLEAVTPPPRRPR